MEAGVLKNDGGQERLERKSAFVSALAQARRKAGAKGTPGPKSHHDTQHDRAGGIPEPPKLAQAATSTAPEEGDRGAATAAQHVSALPRNSTRSSLAIVAMTVLAGFVLAAIFAYSLPDFYDSSAEILVDPGGSDWGAVDGRLPILSSAATINQVVERLNLESDPEFNGEATDLLTRISALARYYSGNTAGARRKAIAAQNVRNAVSVKRDRSNSVVEVDARSQTPRKAALIANTVTALFLEADASLRAQLNTEPDKSAAGRISRLRTEADAAQRRVDLFRAKNDIPGLDGVSAQDDGISGTASALAEAEAQRKNLNEKVAAIRALTVGKLIANGVPPQIKAPALDGLRNQYVSIKRDVDRLAISLGDRHPLTLRLRAQLERMRAGLADQLRETIHSLDKQRRAAISSEKELSTRLDRLKARQDGKSGLLATLKSLEQDASSARSIYEKSLLNLQPKAAEVVPQGPNFSALSKAEPPLSPAGPQRSAIILAGGMIGLVFGLLLVSIRFAMGTARRAPSGEKGKSAGTIAAPREEIRNTGANGPSAMTSEDETTWPSPEFMPANPYGGRPGLAGKSELPAAYRGVAAKNSEPNSFGPHDADIAALKERLEAFREKIGRTSGNKIDENKS